MSPGTWARRGWQPQNGCVSGSSSSQKVTDWPMLEESFQAQSISSIIPTHSPVEIRAKDALKRVPTWPLRFCWKRLKGWLRPKASPQILNSRRRPPSSDQVAFRHSTSPLSLNDDLRS